MVNRIDVAELAHCPFCQAPLGNDLVAGELGRCPRCGNEFAVSAAERAVPAGELPLIPGEPAPAIDPAEVAVVAPRDDAEDARGPFDFFHTPAWMFSMVVHMVVLIALGMLTLAVDLEQFIKLEAAWSVPESTSQDTTAMEEVEEPAVITELALVETVLPATHTFAAPNELTVPTTSALRPTLALSAPITGMALEGRDEAARLVLVSKYGGTAESESAVGKGLEWLKQHQRSDGSWKFSVHTCGRDCSHPGSSSNTTGATAMALLPFLGAGQTHTAGLYPQTVRRGLKYLAEISEQNGGNLQGNETLYCHGLAAIALCEAYAMTQDEEYKQAAQLSLDFIAKAQDPTGGGWRYTPGQPGDTSVMGWQLMALKSGQMGYLKVPPGTTAGATAFLNSVSSPDGAFYGYTTAGKREGTTAVGLLCRMYLGWKKDHAGLGRGVQYLDQCGPSQQDMYYNYYATQVMHHWGGDEWDRWNSVMREYLVRTQATEGHEQGSWYLPHRWSSKGGRLYNTSLAIMTLEVYYRHLPLYKDDTLTDDLR